jgi:hypothetical protein
LPLSYHAASNKNFLGVSGETQQKKKDCRCVNIGGIISVYSQQKPKEATFQCMVVVVDGGIFICVCVQEKK